MSDILDALDELTRARDLIQLIEMTTRHDPCDDRKALSCGCEAALFRLNAGIAILNDTKEASHAAA